MSPASPTFSPDGRWLVSVSSRITGQSAHAYQDLYLTRPDGTGRRLLSMAATRRCRTGSHFPSASDCAQRRLALRAGVRPRFAPHQQCHAHALELELAGEVCRSTSSNASSATRPRGKIITVVRTRRAPMRRTRVRRRSSAGGQVRAKVDDPATRPSGRVADDPPQS